MSFSFSDLELSGCLINNRLFSNDVGSKQHLERILITNNVFYFNATLFCSCTSDSVLIQSLEKSELFFIFVFSELVNLRADYMTKPLFGKPFKDFRNEIMGHTSVNVLFPDTTANNRSVLEQH